MEKRFLAKNLLARQLPPVIESTVSGELMPVLIKFAMIPYVVPPPPPAPPPRPPSDPIILGAAPTLSYNHISSASTDMITDVDAPPPPPPAPKKFVHIDTPKVINYTIIYISRYCHTHDYYIHLICHIQTAYLHPKILSGYTVYFEIYSICSVTTCTRYYFGTFNFIILVNAVIVLIIAISYQF